MRARLVNVLLLVTITSCIIFVSAQEGFTSIDCGGNASFIDNATKIQWTTDDGYPLFGRKDTLAEDYLRDTEREMTTVRSFPEGNKNCYELKATNGTKYLVTVRFLYGNFDRESGGSGYIFHLIIDTVVVIPDITAGDNSFYYQLILVAASDIISVCFGKVTGTPFVNAIELRTLTSRMYPKASTDSILWVDHYNIQYDRVPIIRYPDDRYDRYWRYVYLSSGGESIETDEQIRTGNSTDEVPQRVMKTGLEATNDTLTSYFTVENRLQSSQTFFFADLKANSSRPREFKIQISIDGDVYGDAGPVQPGYLNASSIEMKFKASMSESSERNLANNNLFGHLPDGLFKSHLLQIDYSNNPKLRRRIHGLTRTQKNIIIAIVVLLALMAIVVGLLYLRPD